MQKTYIGEGYMPHGEDWLTTDEIAKDLKVNVKTVRNWINSGELAAIDVGGEYRIYRKDYEDFINRRKIDRGRKD
jgi:excisionase family DNA binding protein